VQEQSLERADLNLRSARGFFEVGTRPKSDVARAEVDVANAKVDLIRARNAERVARVALNTAMGIPADTPTQVQDILFYQQMQLDSKQLQTQALAQRPEYKQVRLRVSQAEAQLRRANRDFLPDVTGHGTYGGARNDLNEVWEVGVALTWNIFDGGNMIAQVREKRALVDSARAQVKVTELNIAQEVEQTYLVVNEAQERIAASQTAVASAQENFRLAQGRFDAGVGTILELTDAQLFLTQAQNAEAQALADYRVALAALERATGRR
jgi:outer membrane protein TolC